MLFRLIHTIKKSHIYLIILIVLSSLLAIDLSLHKGIFTAHDIDANVGRFGAFYLSITEGHILPSWAGYVANGYGSPILMFTYLTPYYLELPLKLVGFSLVNATKIYIFFSWIFSAVFFYLWLRKHLSRSAALTGSLFYVYAPYRINDIFARGSISEYTAFLFLPLLALSLELLIREPKSINIYIVSVFFTMLILSHPFFIIVTAPFFVFYTIALLLNKNNGAIRPAIISVIVAFVLGAMISAFLLLPLFFENKYLHYNINPFLETWKTQFVSLKKLVKPEWTFIDITGKREFQTWQLGLLHIFMFIISFFTISKITKEKKLLLIAAQASFIVGVLFMNKLFYPLYQFVSPLQNIQFPWRFTGVIVMSSAIIAAIVIDVLKNIVKRKMFLIYQISILLVLVILNLPFSHGHSYIDKSDHYYLYELVSNTEGVATTPIWAATPENYPRASFVPRVVEGKASITYLFRNNTRHIYNIEVQKPATIVEDTFYFPNWRVIVNGNEMPIEYQNANYRGSISYLLPTGKYAVEVRFEDTKLRKLAKIISLTTAFFVLIAFFKELHRKHTNKQ